LTLTLLTSISARISLHNNNSRHLNLANVKIFYPRWNKSIRLCLLYSHDINSYEAQLRSQLERISIDRLRQLINQAQQLDLDTTAQLSNRLFAAYPGPSDCRSVRTEISGPAVYAAIRHAFGVKWSQVISDFYHILLVNGHSRTTGGYMLEKVVHAALVKPNVWAFLGMELPSRSSSRSKTNGWSAHSSSFQHFLYVSPSNATRIILLTDTQEISGMSPTGTLERIMFDPETTTVQHSAYYQSL